jgi:hypothetical protein
MYGRDINNINKDLLVDLFSTATYSCDWLMIKTPIAERHLDDKFSQEYLDNRCIEEKWADRLLSGGNICVYDLEEEERYVINFEKIKEGLIKAQTEKAVDDWTDFVDGNDDYFTCNNLLQVIIFGEVVYG